MANIIEDFAVTFGFDTTQFTKEQNEVLAGFKKLEDNALKSAKELETSGKRGAEGFFGAMTKSALELFAVIIGAESLGKFITGTAKDLTTLQIAAEAVDLDPHMLATYGTAVREMGGDAKAARAHLEDLAKMRASVMMGGVLTPEQYRAFGFIHGTPFEDPLVTARKFAERYAGMTPQQRIDVQQQLGFGPGEMAVIRQGPAAFDRQIAGAGSRTPTDADIDAWARLTREVRRFTDAVINATQKFIISPFGKPSPETTKIATDFGHMSDAIDRIDAALSRHDELPKWMQFDIWKGLLNWVDQVLIAFTNLFNAMDSASHGNWGEAAAQAKAAIFGAPKSTGDYSTQNAPGGVAPGPAPSGRHNVAAGTPSRFEAFFRTMGLTAEQAEGVVAGIVAETGGKLTADVTNPTSGAYGIGQWLGSRKAALFKRFGPHPTLANELVFMMSELMGGDRGGAAVRAAGSKEQAMMAYLADFMRPGRGLAGDVNRAYAFMRSAGSSQITIGTMNINAPRATDAKGIAREIRPALSSLTPMPANTGLTG